MTKVFVTESIIRLSVYAAAFANADAALPEYPIAFEYAATAAVCAEAALVLASIALSYAFLTLFADAA